MMNGERKEGICRLNVDGNGCDYLRILSDLETKLRNNTNPKEKIELALQGALMFYGADRAYLHMKNIQRTVMQLRERTLRRSIRPSRRSRQNTSRHTRQ